MRPGIALCPGYDAARLSRPIAAMPSHWPASIAPANSPELGNDLAEVGRLGRTRAGGGRQALLEECHEPLLPHALTPARQRGAIKGQFVLEELLSAEELKIGVLDSALIQH